MKSEKWVTYNLDEVYEFKSGLSKPRSEFGFGNSFLTFKEVFNNTFLPEELNELVNSNESEQLKSSIRRGDVFLTRTSEKLEELGFSAVSLKDYPGATFNGFTKRLRPKVNFILPEYAGFYFRSPKFRKQVTSMASMTTRASLNNSILSKLSIDVPPMSIQQKIASILYSLNAKLSLNYKIIANLEELAQSLFKRWFIDFEFPNEDGDPYRFSGGRMVESEAGLIPDGWTVKSLDEIAHYQNGLAMQKYPPELESNSLPVIKIRELNRGTTNADSNRCSKNIKESTRVYDGDIIFSWSGTLLVKAWTGGNAGLNQHLFKITSDHYPKWLYYYWTLHHLRQFTSIAQDKATTMGHIKRSHLKEAKVAIPVSNEELECFNSKMSPFLEKIIETGIEIRKLKALRDTLLPKLLSGEIEINEESEVEANATLQ